MFNALASLDAIEGARVLDLFAGSGALGIEALSRGAEHVTFVDSDRAARKAVDANLTTTGYANRAAVVASTAEVFLSRSAPGGASFSLVLLDPPYGFDDEAWSELLDALTRHREVELVVLESGGEIPIDSRWDVVRRKWYGGTLLTILQPSIPPPDDQHLEPT
jgi:16S rRNA (guanine966-N2)-methyltransferase